MKFVSQMVPAHALVEDDKFKMAGKMYIIKHTTVGVSDGRKHISFVAMDNPFDRCSLLVHPMTQFKIYNQK